ncbi:MAG: lipid II flippase MurJ [Kiritimatiellae bacterium]|nr:lipid II flippase MurJ [Kiritimatiellia bacterium]
MATNRTKMEKRIFKASAFVLLAHILFKLAGFIQAQVMGRLLPPETFDVVYTFAFENGVFMLFLISEEALAPAFLPLFMRLIDRGRITRAWSFANTVLSTQFVLLIIVALFFFFAPQWAVTICTKWSSSDSPERFDLAAYSLKMLSPAIIGLSLGSTTYIMLNAYKRFFLAAFGDAVWKFCAVGFLVVGYFLSKDSAQMLAWGIVAGSLCKLATHLYGLRDKLGHFKVEFNFRHPFIKRLFWLMLPLLAGILVAKVRDVSNNVYFLSSLEESGLMQANTMGRKLQSTLHWLVPYTLSIAVFPFFCELVDEKNQAELGRLVTHFGRILLATFIPFALLIAVISVPFTAFVFKGGFFDETAVHRTALALSFYTFVLPAGAIEALTMQAFFANRRMWTVTLLGMFFSLTSILFSWAGFVYAGTNGVLLLCFIAGGFTLSRILKSFALTLFLKQSAPVFPFKETWTFLIRITAASIVAGLGAWFTLSRLTAWFIHPRVLDHVDLANRTGDLIKLGITSAVFVAIYLAATYALKISEIHELYSLSKTQLLKMRKRKSA